MQPSPTTTGHRCRRRDERRSLALVDVENLLACPPAEATVADYSHAVARLAAAARLRRTDQVVIGCGARNPEALFGIRSAWPSARILVRGGPDGADHAITDDLHDLDAVRRSYHTVVVGSGDHHFAPFAARLRALGLRVAVVSWEERLSRDLRREADVVIGLTDVPSAPVALEGGEGGGATARRFSLAA